MATATTSASKATVRTPIIRTTSTASITTMLAARVNTSNSMAMHTTMNRVYPQPSPATHQLANLAAEPIMTASKGASINRTAIMMIVANRVTKTSIITINTMIKEVLRTAMRMFHLQSIHNPF